MHVDEVAAQEGFFGKLVASGWHALALTMRLVVETQPFGDAPLIGAELGKIRFTKPIPPETDLFVRITFDAIEEGKGLHSYNILKVETLDAGSGDVLIRQQWRTLRT
jgi:acyl dehydratase